jgi:hypothetical protein
VAARGLLGHLLRHLELSLQDQPFQGASSAPRRDGTGTEAGVVGGEGRAPLYRLYHSNPRKIPRFLGTVRAKDRAERISDRFPLLDGPVFPGLAVVIQQKLSDSGLGLNPALLVGQPPFRFSRETVDASVPFRVQPFQDSQNVLQVDTDYGFFRVVGIARPIRWPSGCADAVEVTLKLGVFH